MSAALNHYRQAAAQAGVHAHPADAAVLIRRSPVLARAVIQHPAHLETLARSLWRHAEKPLQAYLQEALAIPVGNGDSLRAWRRQELIRIVLRETETRDLRASLRELSDLAQATIEAAYRAVRAKMERQYGPQPTDFCVIGMGKLGSRELNLSSDIDLIYLYATDRDEHTHGWFRRLCQHLTQLLSDVTPAGFCYRVDLGLRPEGQTGPICNSLAACERYYESWGHPWERIAWLRARPVAGDLQLGDTLIAALEPFVYRKHIDLHILEEIADLKSQIDARAAQGAHRDIKLGPGGIREVEFLAQSLQLVHGGRIPALRTRDTLEALDRLTLGGLLPDPDRDTLQAAYLFLRAVEHQLQMLEERQTHVLPEPGEHLTRVAHGLDYPTAAALEDAVSQHRERVSALWRGLFATAEAAAADPPPLTGPHVQALASRPQSPLHPRRRARFRQLNAALCDAMAQSPDPQQAAHLLGILIGNLPRNTGIWTFLQAHPSRLRALMHLLGTSRLLGALVCRNPALLHLVVLGSGGPPRSDRLSLRHQLGRQPPEGVEEALIRLRSLHQGEILRIGYYEIAQELDGRDCDAELTLLAEETLRAAFLIAREHVEARYGPLDGQFGVIALGRLGAREMSWGSDLDLLFVCDQDAHSDRFERHARLAQRLLSALSLPMGSGRLYPVDMRLRPSGNQGPLLVSPDALARYYARRATVFEQQALLRARLIIGPAVFSRALDSTQAEILARPRDSERLCAEVRRLQTRQRREIAREDHDHRDLKFGRGGLVQLDLILQTTRFLSRTSEPPRSTNTRELISQLDFVPVAGQPVAHILSPAYEFLRQLESRLRIALGRPQHRIALTEPTLSALARRMGYHDLPGRTASQALADAYQAHADAVHAIYAHVLREDV